MLDDGFHTMVFCGALPKLLDRFLGGSHGRLVISVKTGSQWHRLSDGVGYSCFRAEARRSDGQTCRRQAACLFLNIVRNSSG